MLNSSTASSGSSIGTIPPIPSINSSGGGGDATHTSSASININNNMGGSGGGGAGSSPGSGGSALMRSSPREGLSWSGKFQQTQYVFKLMQEVSVIVLFEWCESCW